ncbi:membrane-spanning 4-domains subfamily A member 4A-like isoform X1 [Erpetoichthys calabaricus]|uniref:membrane-spanning 4-domains subfamily A member 4A-like isoform X1 n=1 Tax=Erpetoichthys calabaricus TaxID=27687 RepID=UPI002234099A|nr:membrane-spanning 4-domains subfamily A member 4A-like isoform X1 [Erpetoichthys calabaricus]
MSSSSVIQTHGMLVVTQIITPENGPGYVVPSAEITKGGFCQLPKMFHKFLKGEPKPLGIVQIMIGIVNFLFGIILCFIVSLAAFTGIPFWTGLMYIISGSFCVAASKNSNSCLIKGALGTNIVSAIFSGIAIIIYSLDVTYFSYTRYRSHSTNNENSENYECQLLKYLYLNAGNGIKGILLVFAILEFCVTISLSAFGCKALCGNNIEPSVIIQKSPESTNYPVQNYSDNAIPPPPTQEYIPFTIPACPPPYSDQMK